LGAFSSFVNQCPVHLDADAAGTVLLGGADDDAAVAAAEVVNYIPLLDLGEFEHLIYDFNGCGDERYLFRIVDHRNDEANLHGPTHN
jgi:hypothetical protein